MFPDNSCLSSYWRSLEFTFSTSSLHGFHTSSYSTTIWCAIRGSWRTRLNWRFSAACVHSLGWHSWPYRGFKLRSWGIRSFMMVRTNMVTFIWLRQSHCECRLVVHRSLLNADLIRIASCYSLIIASTGYIGGCTFPFFTRPCISLTISG